VKLQNPLSNKNPSKSDFAVANPEAVVHPTVRIWAGSLVRETAELGENTSLGRDCYVGPGVKIGKNCKIQNQALIYEPCIIGDGVFIGPRVVITNDLNPRSVTPDGVLKTPLDWTSKAATIESGASLGAGVITVAGIKIGKWAMIAAGAVVTTDVPDHALFAGVPARQIGWVSEEGFKLEAIEGDVLRCPASGKLFRLSDNGILVRQS
jgi:UDP-2-acetamido-3-amino-2,3-dideoxy-glucuronate N-acetyltransferase